MHILKTIERGEIWQIDMGIAGKVRPCLLLTSYPADNELAMVTVIPHTTALRGNPWELSIPKSFLKDGASHFQQIQSASIARLIRRIGCLTDAEMAQVEDTLRRLLHLP